MIHILHLGLKQVYLYVDHANGVIMPDPNQSHEPIIQRFLSHLCGGVNNVRDDVISERDHKSNDVGIKSIIKPSKWQQQTLPSYRIDENGMDMETIKGYCTKDHIQRRIENRTSFMDLIPCYHSTTKWGGRSVHYKEENDMVLPYGGDDDDSYSDESTRMFSFFSDHDDTYLHNLVADYLKNRLIHLHSRKMSPLSHYEEVDQDGNVYHTPLLTKQAIVLEEEHLCSTSHSDDGAVNSCHFSTGSSASFDSREKYSLNNQQQQHLSNECLSTVNVIEPSPCSSERYSFLKDTPLSIEHPLKFYEEKMKSLWSDEKKIHLNTILSENNMSPLSTSDPCLSNPLVNERYMYSTTMNNFNDASIEDPTFTDSAGNDNGRFIPLDSPDEPFNSMLSTIRQKLKYEEGTTVFKKSDSPSHETIANKSRYQISSPFDSLSFGVNLDSKFSIEDKYQRTVEGPYVRNDVKDCGRQDFLTGNMHMKLLNIRKDGETIIKGTKDIPDEVILTQSSLDISEFVSPIHRLKKVDNDNSLLGDNQIELLINFNNETVKTGTGNILEELALIRSSINKSELLGPFHRVKKISKSRPYTHGRLLS